MTVDNQMREQILFESYRSPGFIDTRSALQEAMNLIEGRIYKLKDSPTRKELQALYAEVKSAVAEAYKPLPGKIQKEAAQASQLVFEANAGRRLPILPIKKVVSKDLNIQGYDFSELMQTTSASHARKLKVEIASHIAAGSSPKTIIKAMRSKNSKLTDAQLRSTVNTTIAEARAEARYAAYASMEDNIESYTYLATLDSRTSPLCRPLDGKTWKVSIDEVPYKPPIHFNCRSVLVPNVEGYKPVSRASAKGPVDASMTYAQWLGTQTPTFQKGVLGAAKYELYTSGSLPAPTLYDTIDRDTRDIEDIREALNPVSYSGTRTAESQMWTESSFNALLESKINIGKPEVISKGRSLVLKAQKGGFKYELTVGPETALLTDLELPESFIKKGLHIETLKSLQAMSVAGNKQLKVKGNSFMWLRTGLVQPENVKSFNRELMNKLGYKGSELIKVEGLLAEKDYKTLFSDKKHEKDIKNALGSWNLSLNVI